MAFEKLGAEIFRDYDTDGVPASGAHDVDKADMRRWMLEVEGQGVGSLGDGSAASPVITFAADTNTGIYRIGADTIGFTAGGTGRLRVDTTSLSPVSNDGLALGTTALGWSDLFGATGFVWNVASGNWVATHTSGDLEVTTGTLTLGNAGLHLRDSDASHDLIITPGSNLSVDRVLTITTGDAARTLDISAASVTVSSFGASLVDDAAASNARTTLGLVIGTDVQAYDAELAALAGLTSAADKLPYFSGSGTAALADLTAAGRALLDDASAAAQRTTLGSTTVGDAVFIAASAAAGRTALGVVIGTDVQAYDADLGALAANSTNGIWARTGSGTGAARTLTAGSGTGIAITDGDGVAGNPTLALSPTGVTAPASFGSGDKIPIFDGGTTLKLIDFTDLPGAGGGITDVVQDTTPQLGGDLDANGFKIGFDDSTGITDDSGNEQLWFKKTASAITYLEITNAATGNPPKLKATGETNTSMIIDASGTGGIRFDHAAYSDVDTLTDGATISWDGSVSQKAKVTLGAAGRTMAAMSNAIEGTTYFLWVIQDGTGSRTITTWTSSGAGSYDFGTDGQPTLTTTASRADLLCFEAISIGGTLKLRFCGIKKGFA